MPCVLDEKLKILRVRLIIKSLSVLSAKAGPKNREGSCLFFPIVNTNNDNII